MPGQEPEVVEARQLDQEGKDKEAGHLEQDLAEQVPPTVA